MTHTLPSNSDTDRELEDFVEELLAQPPALVTTAELYDYHQRAKKILEALEEVSTHLYSASQVRQALVQTLKPKTDPDLMKAIIEDVGEALHQQTKLQGGDNE